MKKINLFLLVAVFLVLFSIANVFAKDSCGKWTTQLRPGLRGGDGKTFFYTDYLTPLSSDEKSLVFLNLKVMMGNVHTNEENLGIGYRRLLDEKWILGANFFYDTRYSKNGFRHYQIGCGLEALSKWIDFRANYYHPISGEKHIEDEDYYGFGERSLLKYEKYEEALKGFDAEVSFLVPKISNFVKTKIYGGGYWYNSKLGRDVEGVKAGVEIRPSPALAFNVEAKNDNVFGSNTFIEGYVTLPFEVGNIFKGKNPLAGWKDFLRGAKGQRKLKKRMTDPVVRDINIMTCENTKEKKLHDMIYVDNSNDADPAEDGSLSHPYNTLDEAFSDPLYGEGIWIYVKKGDGTANGYTGNYTLADNVTLWGEGYEYLGLGGGGYPIIDGGSTGDVITLGSNNTIMGCQIQNHGDEVSGGIYGNNPGTVSIIGNNINCENSNGDAYGIYLESNNSANTITVLENSIKATGNGGETKTYGIYLENSGTPTNVINISDNTISSIDNWILGMPHGIYIRNSGGSINTINITNNTMRGTISGDFSRGILVEGYDTSTNTISISGNALSDFSGESAVGICVIGYNSSTNTATISGNNISSFMNMFGADGILLSGYDSSTNAFTVSGNNINGFWDINRGSGIHLETGISGASSESENTIIISANTITNFDAGNMYGINLIVDEGSRDYVTIFRNTIALRINDGSSTGIYIERKGGTIEVDMGGGSLGSEGYNCIYDNEIAIEHNLEETVKAENNWWGSPEPSPTFIGDVDYIPYLTSNPNE
ncbi:inverse autotransporter beta domain-containing protein [Candidatus Aerophobetes bacterium]|nr:inverse autotransporter beta domain-containing protein [Candidatus Aerophobetes bacterium]